MAEHLLEGCGFVADAAGTDGGGECSGVEAGAVALDGGHVAGGPVVAVGFDQQLAGGGWRGRGSG